MSSCAQCRFWDRNGFAHEIYDEKNDYNGEETPHRKCFAIIHGNGSGAGEKMRAAPAAVLDGSGYAASLWTLPTFGCALFAAIEDP